VVALRQALRQGIFFTRYLPDLAFGYGYPFFNYRAPLPYYLILGLHLTGIGLPLADNLTYALCILGSALAAYLLARDLFGPRAGIVAAIAYAYAPYQFLDALLRGNVPESVALLLVPLILWAFRRLALTGRRRWFLVSVAALASLYLSHNISSLLFTPFLVAFLFVLWLVYRRLGHWRAVGGALVLAAGLTAFFWGPALLEREYVQLHMSYTTRNNDFHHNFLPLAEVFSPPISVDTSLMNPPIRVHLGLVQALLAGIGLVAGLIRWRDRERRTQLVLFALVAVAMIWMSTRASLPLWEHVPLLRFVQFPWRLVGRATLPVALLAGASASAIPLSPDYGEHADAPRRARWTSAFLVAALVALLVLAAYPYTYPPLGYCSRAPQPTISDLFRYEHRNDRAGLAASGSFFPVWVRQRPDGSPLQDQYAAGSLVTRFDETALPDGAELIESDYGPNRARLIVHSPEPFDARYLSFYFPGWRVWVDGEKATVTPSNPEGFITFQLPAGRHTVQVRFGETPLRRVADAISALSLVSLVVVLFLRSTSETCDHPARLDPGTSGAVLITAGLLLTLKLVVVDRMETPIRHAGLRAENPLPCVEHLLNRPFADGMTLIGYEQSAATMPSDGTLRVDMYWTVQHQPSRRYQTVVRLRGLEGFPWSPKDSYRPTDHQDAPPTTAWRPGRYALDSHEVIPLTGTPPGTYDVVLTVFDRDTLTPLSVLNEKGQPAAPELVLGQVRLAAPHDVVDPGALDIQHRLDRPLGPVTLLGINFSRSEAAPGDPVLATTFWRSEKQTPVDLELQVTLRAPDGSRVVDHELPLATGWHPTTTWRSGEIWRGQHRIYLPADLDSAEYRWELSLLPIQRSTDLPAVLMIDAPERAFTPPSVDSKLGSQVGDVATLVGASFEPDPAKIGRGETLTATLLWRAESLTHTSYHVFLHLIGPDGQLLDQSDGIPSGWSRPTTGWLKGEYITDVRSITVPGEASSGQYALLTGLYVPGGERLFTPGGADATRVLTITLHDR
jgi:hypothetical protein